MLPQQELDVTANQIAEQEGLILIKFNTAIQVSPVPHSSTSRG